MLDLLTGVLALVTAVMAGATVFLGVTTCRSVREAARTASAAQAAADATLALVLETRRNRELEMQPVVVRVTPASVMIGPGRTVPGVRLRNVGRGAGIGAGVVQQIGGEVFWTEVPFTLASGERCPTSRWVPSMCTLSRSAVAAG